MLEARTIPVCVRGIIFRSRNEACKALRVSKSEVYEYMVENVLDFEDSLGLLTQLTPAELRNIKEKLSETSSGESGSVRVEESNDVQEAVSDIPTDNTVVTICDSLTGDKGRERSHGGSVRSYSESVTVNGVLYKNRSEACLRLRVYMASVHKLQKKKGMTFEEAVNHLLRRKKEIKGKGYVHNHAGSVEAFGVKYSNLGEACRELGVCYSRVYGHMRRRGISFEEALKTHKKQLSGIVIYDRKYSSKTGACKELGLNYSYVSEHARKNNLTFEESVLAFLEVRKSKSR